ncbi:MAG: hypothetical protein IIA92_12635 [Chloroflexi bacterium]|nr:hypothetical protein [Chloroflexota bacterium]
MMIKRKRTDNQKPVEFTKVAKSRAQLDPEDAYVVELSAENLRKMDSKEGDRVKFKYGFVSVTAYLRVGTDLDELTVGADQTLCWGVGLEEKKQRPGRPEQGDSEDSQKLDPVIEGTSQQGSDGRVLVYEKEEAGEGAYSVSIQPTGSTSKNLLSRLLRLDHKMLPVQCNLVEPTAERPGSAGTYIVRLSPGNRQRLGIRNNRYVKVSYRLCSVLAKLIEHSGLDSETIMIDQTLRHAIGLERIMQGSGSRVLMFNPDGGGDLSCPVMVQRTDFRGPDLTARALKQQYLVCRVHNAMTSDMETPIARLTKDAMDVIGIQPGEKIRLVGEENRLGIRCLALDSEINKKLPLPSMHKFWTCPDPALSEPEADPLPWVTLDQQTRLALALDPWHTVFVGRDPRNKLASEFSLIASALALSALGGAIIVPYFNPWLPLGIVAAGFVGVLALTWAKIRSTA